MGGFRPENKNITGLLFISIFMEQPQYGNFF